jgi:FkbM family methyltransferase
MGILGRAKRKLRSIGAYTALAQGWGDRRELLALGLAQNWFYGSSLAARILAGGRVVAPRLRPARGERVRVELAEPGQRDAFKEIFVEGVYDTGAVVFAPDLVVDCGAFCGFFTALAAGLFPSARLVCFEANPAQFPAVRAQAALLSRPVEFVEAAVFTRDGTVSFSGTGMGGSVGAPAAGADASEVACIDFPAWLTRRRPESLVLKMDIEGAEVELLPRVLALLPRRAALLLETHVGSEVCEELLAPYRSAGFEVRETRRRPGPGGRFDYVEWVLTRGR